jgi:hypothetical protein
MTSCFSRREAKMGLEAATPKSFLFISYFIMISPRFKKNLHKNQTSDLFLFYHSSDDFSFFICFIFCGITFPPFSFFFVQHLAN